MTTPPPRPARDSKSDLLEAAKAAVQEREAAAARAAVERAGPARRRRFGIELLILAAGSVLLLLRPAWLVGPDAFPHERPAVAAASLRLTLLRERERLLDYRARHGLLPPTLAEAGVLTPGLEYRRLSAQEFQLTGRAGDSVVAIGAGDSVAAFLGATLKALQHREQP